MTGLVWEDPPPTKRGGTYSYWQPVADQLRQHPGRWALARVYERPEIARSTAVHIRQGRMSGMTPGEFEIAVRGCKVYARFTPHNAAPTAETGARS